MKPIYETHIGRDGKIVTEILDGETGELIGEASDPEPDPDEANEKEIEGPHAPTPKDFEDLFRGENLRSNRR